MLLPVQWICELRTIAIWRSTKSNGTPFLFNLCPFPDSPALHVCNNYSQSVQPFDHISQALNCWPLKPPKMAPWGIVGRIVLAYVPEESTDVYRIWWQSVHPFGSFPRLKFVTPTPPPRNAPCGNVGRIVYSYVHSQTNPHTCTKCGANRSSRLTASQDIGICDPLTPPPKCPLGYCGATCIQPMSSPRWIRTREPKLVHLFDGFPRLLNLWPPKTPRGIEGRMVFSLLAVRLLANASWPRQS